MGFPNDEMILVGIFLLTVQGRCCCSAPGAWVRPSFYHSQEPGLDHYHHHQEPGHDAGELEAGLGQHHRQAPAHRLAQPSLVSILVMSLRRLVAMMKVFVMFVVGNTMTVIMRTSRPNQFSQ